MRALQGPEPPDSLQYLVEWAYALCGRSGASMAGIAPLSYSTVAEWARLMNIDPSPLEIQGLMILDGVMRNPESDEPEVSEEIPEVYTWPERKSDG